MFELHLENNTVLALLKTAGVHDARDYLNGVYVEPQGDTLFMVATDGARMSVYRRVNTLGNFEPFVIPRSLLSSLKAKGACVVTRDGKMVTVQSAYTSSTAKEPEVAFPSQWRFIIPKETSGEPANFNPEYYADIDKAAKLLKVNINTAHLRHNGERGALVLLHEDFLVVLAPLNYPRDKQGHTLFTPATPFTAPAWIR